MPNRVPVTFLPSGSIAWAEPGTTVLAAGRSAGVNISAPCGGRGVCGSCSVRVTDGSLAEPTGDERAALRRAPAGVRLACRARIAGPVTVRPIVLNSTMASSSGELRGDSELVIGVDLGTTTVSAAVVDVASGGQLGTATVLNRQLSYGADILSRVSASLEGAASELRSLAEESVLHAIDSAAPGARRRIERVVIAANVAMASLLTGADVRSLATHPFTPPAGCDALALDTPLVAALSPARVELVPPVGGLVGGDVLAGLVALGMSSEKGPRLLVDIGTNAEVALVRDGHMWVTSAAAGPAFEGGGISCGGPAAPEAVVGVEIDGAGAVSLRSSAGVTPEWFSGAGLVSAVAELRRAGHLDSDGRLDSSGPIAQRFSLGEDQVLAVGLGESDGCLSVTQLDVRELQLAKAAVRVAIASVLGRARVRASDLQAVYVAGAFGAALSRRDLIELGVVPVQAEDVVVQAGNTSLRGATALAVDATALDSAARLASRAVVVDLATEVGFAERLLEALSLSPYSA